MYIKNIKEYKKSLRQQYRQIRETMEAEKKFQMDESIFKRILTLKEYKKEMNFFTYVSKEIEVDTMHLIEAALQAGKHVAVPRCVPGTYEMEFYYIQSLEDLAPGMFGVLEPILERCRKVEDFSHGFCVVPGLSFDTQGYRLGYGKGYYDRFLSSFEGFTVGICYHNCVRWKLPHGYFDRPVQLLVTDKYLRRSIQKGS